MLQVKRIYTYTNTISILCLSCVFAIGACSPGPEAVPVPVATDLAFTYSELTVPFGDTLADEVVPTLHCVERGPGASFVAHFGYESQVPEFSIEIPVGPDNKFLFGDEDRGQSTTFAPGEVETTFLVESSGEPLIWAIRSPNGKRHFAIATRFSQQCNFDPYCGYPFDPLNPTDVCQGTERCLFLLEETSLPIGRKLSYRCQEFVVGSAAVGEPCLADINGESTCVPGEATCAGFFSRTDEDNPFKLRALCAGFCDVADPSTCDGECVMPFPEAEQGTCLEDEFFDF